LGLEDGLDVELTIGSAQLLGPEGAAGWIAFKLAPAYPERPNVERNVVQSAFVNRFVSSIR
jgi:hypothetical protein